jgi:hypothetical protein
VIFNFINANMAKLRKTGPSIYQFCLPGMTEEYKLNIFIHLEATSSLKLVFVSEENPSDFILELEGCAINIFEEFEKNNITEVIVSGEK